MMRAPRAFSTATRVHPSFLPHLHPQLRHSHLRASTSSVSFRWLKIVAAVSFLGFGAKAYLAVTDRRRAAALEFQEAELLRRNNALLDQYGDRSSLEELEKAVQFYGKK